MIVLGALASLALIFGMFAALSTAIHGQDSEFKSAEKVVQRIVIFSEAAALTAATISIWAVVRHFL